MTVTKKILRRYTNLPSVIHMLSTRRITFLSPTRWDDRNDSYFMELYKDAKKLKTLLAICFSQETETYHHWRVFADGSSGVCVAFHKQQLIDIVCQQRGVTTGEVDYVRINDLDHYFRTVLALPFLKRAPFEPENEFRFVYGSKREELGSLDVEMNLSAIDRIYLSPWMPESIANSVKDALQTAAGSAHVKVTRSTLIQNDRWAEYGRRVASSK
jgi:hypothetical protein